MNYNKSIENDMTRLQDLNWNNVLEKSHRNVYAIVQEGYLPTLEKRGNDYGMGWKRAEAFRVLLSLTLNDEPYSITRYFSKTLFCHHKIFSDRLKGWMSNFAKYMSKKLSLQDFKWIITNTEKNEGYYSLKKDGWEICIDYHFCSGWEILVCNKWEEVLEEYVVANEEKALDIANKIYRSFATTQPIMS